MEDSITLLNKSKILNIGEQKIKKIFKLQKFNINQTKKQVLNILMLKTFKKNYIINSTVILNKLNQSEVFFYHELF